MTETQAMERMHPSWLTVLGHTKDSLWSLDLFRTESIALKTHWVLVVMNFNESRVHSGIHGKTPVQPAQATESKLLDLREYT